MTTSHLEEREFVISENDLLSIKPYLDDLLRLNVYSISEIKNTLAEIEKMNIEDIDLWLNQIRIAVKTMNEERFTFLIKSLLK